MAKRTTFIALVAAALVCAVLLLPTIARAESTSSSSLEAVPKDVSIDDIPEPPIDELDGLPIDGLQIMGNDRLWAGRDLELGGHKVDNDLLAAGQVIRISNCTTGGSIRAAAQDITIADSSAAESITIAGQNVEVRKSKGNAIAMAGNTASFSGSCKTLSAYASKVFIDGTVEGDVYVGASQVEVGSNARIKGTLHVNASSEPVMQRGAEVGDVDFTKSEVSSDQVEGAFAGFAMVMFVVGIIVTIVGTLVVAVLSEWLFKRHTFAASEIIRSRTGATIGTGIIGAVVIPISIILLFLFVVTAPVAIALICVLVAIGTVSGGFMGASLFKLVFPKLGRYKCALAGGAIVGVASAVPIVGGLVHVVAFVYMLGYALQSVYLGTRDAAPTALR